jgi:hypothetical protein
MSSKSDFLYPKTRYQGYVAPENLVFNANLQEFAQKVTFIIGLDSNGKLSSEDSYRQVKALWKELKRSKKQLMIGQHPFNPESDQ